jgi:hypothetical protein
MLYQEKIQTVMSIELSRAFKCPMPQAPRVQSFTSRYLRSAQQFSKSHEGFGCTGSLLASSGSGEDLLPDWGNSEGGTENERVIFGSDGLVLSVPVARGRDVDIHLYIMGANGAAGVV